MMLVRPLQTKKENSQGQSLFEVVISLAVITLIIVSLVILATNSIRNTSFSKNKTLSTRYVQELDEWLRSERDVDWDIFATRALTARYCLQTLSWDTAIIDGCGDTEVVADTVLHRELFFTIVDPANIEIQVVVYWTDANGTHEVRSITNLTDWRTQ